MVLWWIANVVALVAVIPLVVFLGNRVLRVGLEIRRYADDIAEHGAVLAAHLEPVAALSDTREVAARLKASGSRYAAVLERRR